MLRLDEKIGSDENTGHAYHFAVADWTRASNNIGRMAVEIVRTSKTVSNEGLCSVCVRELGVVVDKRLASGERLKAAACTLMTDREWEPLPALAALAEPSSIGERLAGANETSAEPCIT